MEEKIQISTGKEFIVKELLYKQVVDMQNSENKTENVKTLLKLSTGITDEEWDNLTMKDGVAIQKVVNRVNGLEEHFLSIAPQKE